MSFICQKCGVPQEPRTKPILSIIKRSKTYRNYSHQLKKDKISYGFEAEKELKLCKICAGKEGIIEYEDIEEPEGKVENGGESSGIFGKWKSKKNRKDSRVHKRNGNSLDKG